MQQIHTHTHTHELKQVNACLIEKEALWNAEKAKYIADLANVAALELENLQLRDKKTSIFSAKPTT